MQTYIFDLDGTLANIDHRIPLIGNKTEEDWLRFHRACVDDKPITNTIKLLNELFFSGNEILIWTGRSSESINQTRYWLEKNEIQYHKLKMRPKGNHEDDDKLKKSWLDLRGKDGIVGVFEDRLRVVKMLRDEGLTCYHVGGGDF